jgi:hypothetical protein
MTETITDSLYYYSLFHCRLTTYGMTKHHPLFGLKVKSSPQILKLCFNLKINLTSHDLKIQIFLMLL